MATYVIYHADCSDGFGAAWAFWQKYRDDAKYISAMHGHLPPEFPLNSDLFLVDFSYPLDIFNELNNKYNLVVLDHHLSAKRELPALGNVNIDIDKSGSILAWEYLFTSSVPILLRYIEDRDLWLFKLDHSRSIDAFIQSFDFDFKKWNELANILETRFEYAIDVGNHLLNKNKKLVKSICSHAYLAKFEGFEIPAVSTAVLNSEVCHHLLQLFPEAEFAMTWFKTKNNKFKISLRSRGNIDVSAMAQKYKGGGHKNAAGLLLDNVP